ncbi:phenylacetaldoxime dehydratase family protein [Muricoccus aerilatus]|uniref:phenylacetaldoxime dehydratase family protein n=1 Tax=Muricoccus aerilatus TaxID=452982 RepID=UPI0024809C7F|nr:phenylacetaldoxime dehydratase family protein [Roseomonas aerilata]
MGLQSRSESDLWDALPCVRLFLEAASGPDFEEYSGYRDARDFTNEVFACYWLDRARHDAWLRSSGFVEWLEHPDRLGGKVGIWQETIHVSLDRMETIAGQPDYGIARAALNKGDTTRAHAYFGSMRHRIGAASRDGLESSLATFPLEAARLTCGLLVRVLPPANMAVIRSGQDWGAVQDDELRTYLGEVHPKLVQGMEFLRDYPADAGCYSCRFMMEQGPDRKPTKRSSGFAMFLSLRHLEKWSRSHPTHLAIFESFWAMVRKYENARNLRLWHEVIVVGDENPEFIYVNCHDRTGLLRWSF